MTDGEGGPKKDDDASPAAKPAPFKIPPITTPSQVSSPSIQISLDGKPLNVRLPTAPPGASDAPNTDDDWDLPAPDEVAETPASPPPSDEARPIDLSGMSSPKWPIAPDDPQAINAVFVDTGDDGAFTPSGRIVRDTEGDQLYFARAAGVRTDEQEPLLRNEDPPAEEYIELEESVPPVQIEYSASAVQAEPAAYVPPPPHVLAPLVEPEPEPEPTLATGSGEKSLDAPSTPSVLVVEMDADAVPARRLGNYDILQLIGSGGMAEVFLARSRGVMGFEKIVVLKRIHAHLAREPQFVTMFLDEARLAARINDPHVVQIYELGEADGTYFMTMEYLAGESLSTIVKRAIKGGPVLPVTHVARVVADAATGLHAAHELRDSHGRPLEVVHRDVSHGNIVVLYSGGVKVLDFGVAKARDSLSTTQAGERKGKFGYMSPEQVIGEPLDRRSDIFSLGVVLWEALTRQTLFSAGTEHAAMRRVLEGVAPPPSKLRPEVPPALDQIVLRALHKDRRQRFQTAEEMSAALENFLATQPTGARELATFMKSAFPDRIEQRAKLLQIGNDAGEPMPQASIKHTESKVMASDQAVARLEMLRRRNKRALIAGGIAIPILLAVAFYLGRDQEKTKVVQPVATVTAAPPDAGIPQKSLADVTFDRAEIALRNNRVAAPPGDNALELILEGEQLEPRSPRAKALRERSITQLLAVAETLWTNGKLESARSIYSDVLLFDADHELARMRRAGMKLAPAPKSGDADQSQVSWLVSEIDLAIIERRLVEPAGRNALDMLIKLRKLDPKGNATRRLGSDVAKALRGKATEVKPDDAKALLEAAKVATGEKTATEPATPQPQDVENEKPRNPALAKEHIAKGNAQLGGGQLGEARKSFERAISADSAAHGALAGLAEVAYNESDFTRAVLAAKRAIGLAPNSVSYRMLLAKAYYKLLRYEDAIKQWKRVRELDRTNAAAQKNIEMAQRRMGQ